MNLFAYIILPMALWMATFELVFLGASLVAP